ncbi:hypothetical protein ZWY2020_048798 [Hordeum vulgare]|nr:hypothetical protein ZWY2020_048798 [Hordeum vulgare]
MVRPKRGGAGGQWRAQRIDRWAEWRWAAARADYGPAAPWNLRSSPPSSPVHRRRSPSVDTLAGDSFLCKHYGAVPAADAEPATRTIEAEAFVAAAVAGGAAASVEEGIEVLQLYSKEVSRRLLLDFVKSRSAAVGGVVGRQGGDLRGLSSPRPR